MSVMGLGLMMNRRVLSTRLIPLVVLYTSSHSGILTHYSQHVRMTGHGTNFALSSLTLASSHRYAGRPSPTLPSLPSPFPLLIRNLSLAFARSELFFFL